MINKLEGSEMRQNLMKQFCHQKPENDADSYEDGSSSAKVTDDDIDDDDYSSKNSHDDTLLETNQLMSTTNNQQGKKKHLRFSYRGKLVKMTTETIILF